MKLTDGIEFHRSNILSMAADPFSRFEPPRSPPARWLILCAGRFAMHPGNMAYIPFSANDNRTKLDWPMRNYFVQWILMFACRNVSTSRMRCDRSKKNGLE